MQSQRRQQRPTEAKAPHRDLDINKERLLFVLTSIVGHKVTAKLRNNAIYEGVFHGCSLEPDDFSITLKCAREINGSDHVIPVLMIPGKDFLQVSAMAVSVGDILMGEDSIGRFATDAEIAGQKSSANTERELVPWAGPGQADAGSLDEDLGRAEPGQWDQFKANEQRWGITTTFNEELYTTKLDPNTISKEKRDEADRIAREIESGQMASEIEGKVDEDEDEEGRFSAVQNHRRNEPWSDNQNLVTGSSAAAPSGNARDISALSLPIGKDQQQSELMGLDLPGEGFAREHRAKRGMITTHSPMRTSMISEMKRINALNLEPAVPKLDDKTGKDWINFKASQTRNASKPIQGDGLKHEFQQSLEVIRNRQSQQEANKQRELASVGHAQGSMGQSDGSAQQGLNAYSRKTDGQMHVGGESGKAKPFSFNPNAKDFTFNPSTPAFTPTNAASAAAQKSSNQNATPQPTPQGSGPNFTVTKSDMFSTRKLEDILDSFYDVIKVDSSSEKFSGPLEPKWSEASGPSFKEVLGQPNQQLQPMMAQLNPGGGMPGSWQPQNMGQLPPGGAQLPANAAPQMMPQPGYMMPNAPGGQPQQMFQPMYQGGAPPGQAPIQQRPPQNPGNVQQQQGNVQQQPMVFNQQMAQQGNMPPQAMAMPAGMVQVQGGGQNPGAVQMTGPVPKFGMQVMMVPAGYNPNQQQGFPQPQPMQGQPGPQQGQPGQPGQPGPQGGGPPSQMMQQPVYHRQMGMAPPHQMTGHEG